jgi:hypothetical protein
MRQTYQGYRRRANTLCKMVVQTRLRELALAVRRRL